jgi:hypothetical protein
MNEQINSISALITISLFAYFGYCILIGLCGKSKKIIVLNDNYQIGYINRSDLKEPKKQQVLVAAKPAAKPPVKRVVPDINKKLVSECVDILVQIGHKRNEAIMLVTHFLKNNKISTVEDFCVNFKKC